jgi:hypothetical protein
MTTLADIEKLAQKTGKNTVTFAELRTLLRYNPETGEWWYRAAVNNRFKPGVRAGSTGAYGYWMIAIDGRKYKSSRLAFLYMRGRWPEQMMDHIDCNRANDKWSNLREATPTQNSANRRKERRNKSGYKGVSWFSAAKKWVAHIGDGNTQKNLGYFDDPAEAHAAYFKAAKQRFGEYARAG